MTPARFRLAIGLTFVTLVLVAAGAAWLWHPWIERGADTAFITSVAQPALAQRRPTILFDEGHHNVHSLSGRYAPFAKLLRADGCEISAVRSTLTTDSLRGCDVLVIVNPEGAEPHRDAQAFSAAEAKAICDWVRDGGALLLVADHHPFGAAAASLARAFGVEMVTGWYEDDANPFPGTADSGAIVFRAAAGSLGDHPILRGRSADETIRTIVTFTGQSLVAPDPATPLLLCADSGLDRVPVGSTSTTTGGRTITTFETTDSSAAGHCQGLAMTFGSGRVVVLGEAAMLTAQLDAQTGLRFGMNIPGIDNRQFTLNTVRWLAGALD